MKALSAVILTDGLRPREVAGAGLILSVMLVGLGATGAIGRIARLIPQSVIAGLQLGLGLLMAVLGLGLLLKIPWLGFGSPALLLLLMRIPRCPAAALTLIAAVVVGLAAHTVGWPETLS